MMFRIRFGWWLLNNEDIFDTLMHVFIALGSISFAMLAGLIDVALFFPLIHVHWTKQYTDWCWIIGGSALICWAFGLTMAVLWDLSHRRRKQTVILP